MVHNLVTNLTIIYHTFKVITNWAFPNFQELKIEGCEQMLHLPHSDVKMVPFDICVVFRPRAGELAATFFVRSIDEEGLKTEMPVGDAILTAEMHFEGGK